MPTTLALDYTVAIDGAPVETHTEDDAALEHAKRVKREDPDALVTVIVDAAG